MDVWKIINEAPNYLINEYGVIKNSLTNRIMKQRISYKGYALIKLNIEKKIQKDFRINQLVAKAFIPNLLNKPYVNHKDNNKLNNHFLNLEWSTPKENTEHMYKFYYLGLKK